MEREGLFFLLVLFCVLVVSTDCYAQSTDQSNPTALSSNELVITGPKKTNENYFYSFSAGPGQVTLSLSVKAKVYSTFVGIKIYDAESNTLVSHNMSAATGSPGIAVKKFDVAEKQTLVLSFNSDTSLAECKIKFGGAVELGAAEGSSNSNGEMVSQSNPTMSDVSATDTAITDQSSTNGSPGKNKAFLFTILDGVGQRFNIPTSGKLFIEMKDGSVQEVDLVMVKKISVKQ